MSSTFAWSLQIVKRSDAAGFEVLPKRWIVERTHLAGVLEHGLAVVTRGGRRSLPPARVHHALYVAQREEEGREASPTVAIIDSQTAKGAQKGGLGLILRATTRAALQRTSAPSNELHPILIRIVRTSRIGSKWTSPDDIRREIGIPSPSASRKITSACSHERAPLARTPRCAQGYRIWKSCAHTSPCGMDRIGEATQSFRIGFGFVLGSIP